MTTRLVSTARRVARRIARLRGDHPGSHARPGYAQQGEDLVLDCLLQGRPGPGFYVDVGAHHPWRYSNTYFFYRQGWRGINIDATPGSMRPFAKARPRDINLECAIAGERRRLTFNEFADPALNGFSADLSDARTAAGSGTVVRQHELVARPLAEVLDEHLPPGQRIDFLSIDVEGLDLDVLRSNDWGKYRPTIVMAEDITVFLAADVLRTEMSLFMEGIGYGLCAKTVHTHFYADRGQLRIGSDMSVHLGRAVGP